MSLGYRAQGTGYRGRYRVLIVGAGNIGAFFDTPGDKNVLTHAHAFTSHEGFELTGFVDTDIKKAKKAAAIWGVKAYTSVEEAFAAGRIDVVSVSVPDELHHAVLKSLASFPVKLVFAEKPLAKSVREAREICRLYKKKGIKLAVNYTRRYVPEFAALKEEIASGVYGRFISGSAYYGKGLFHNGSHMADLMRYLIGEIGSSRKLAVIRDHYRDDPSVEAVISFKNGGNLSLMCVPPEHYTVFECDLFFEKKRVRITDAGFKMERYDVKPSKVFKGYRNLTLAALTATRMGEAMLWAVDNIYAHFSGKAALKCSGADALGTIEACEKIKRSV